MSSRDVCDASSAKVVRGLPEEIELDRALYRLLEAGLEGLRSWGEKNPALCERWLEEFYARLEGYDALQEKMVARTLPLSVQCVDGSLHERFEKFYRASKWQLAEAYRRACRAHENGNADRVSLWYRVFEHILANHETLADFWLRNYPANADSSVQS